MLNYTGLSVVLKTFSYPWVLSSILENGSFISILETVFQSDDIDNYIDFGCDRAPFAILAIFVRSREIVYDVK